MEYSRLFDLIYFQKENKPKDVCLAGKEITASGKKEWKTYSTDDVILIVNKVSKSLLDLGVKKDDKIALISNNRPEWNFLDLGMQQIGAVNVPIYPTISKRDYQYIFNDAGISFAFVSDADLYAKVNAIRQEVSSLKEIYTFDKIEGALNWRSILKDPTESDTKKIEDLKATVKSEDLATIIYTSGTTGDPKGVMLTHHNLISNVQGVSSVLPLDLGERALSFLPLCHSFERMVSYNYLRNSVSIYYAENMETIGENLKEVHPHYFSTVPRLLEKVYEKIMEKGLSLEGFKRKLFMWSIDLGNQFDLHNDQGLIYNTKLGIARKLVFSKWKEALGGEVIAIVTGAAAMQPRLARLFTAAGVNVIEGYGLTETSPVLTVNRMELMDRELGTVGIPIPGVEIKLAEDGEILAKGPNIMKGYYNKPELTKEVIDENGWFHTGDVGTWIKKNGNEFLKITDRIKELFKTSGGKYVAPQPIENKFKEYNLIEQIMIVGENRKFISALIIPSFTNLKDFCSRKDLNTSSKELMVSHPEVIEAYDKEIGKLNQNFGKVEQVKKFTLLPVEWDIDGGELTPTMKLKRKIILEKHKNEIEELYNV